jgi:hypothetical protein
MWNEVAELPRGTEAPAGAAPARPRPCVIDHAERVSESSDRVSDDVVVWTAAPLCATTVAAHTAAPGPMGLRVSSTVRDSIAS